MRNALPKLFRFNVAHPVGKLDRKEQNRLLRKLGIRFLTKCFYCT